LEFSRPNAGDENYLSVLFSVHSVEQHPYAGFATFGLMRHS
jgi:hypothetical protein